MGFTFIDDGLGSDDASGKVIGLKATGKLTDADYKAIIPELEARIQTHNRICLLVDVQDFEGWELHAAWDDFSFGMTHWLHFERLALVGDANWEELAAGLMDTLMNADVRFYRPEELDDAWVWVRGKVPVTS